MLTKKTQLMTVAIAFLIPITAHAQNDIGGTAAAPDDNQELQKVVRATTEIIIDGDLSEWDSPTITDPLIGIPKVGRDGRVDGDPPTRFVIHEELGGTWTGRNDQSSETQLAWDADGLYIGVVVTDEYHENSANSPWNGDSLQMMVTTDDRTSDFALYNYALGGIEDDHVGFEEDPPLLPEELFVMHERGFADFGSDLDYLLYDEDDEANVAIMRDTIEGTTTYEIFLGTEALGLEVEEMAEGTELGLAMAINDGDEDAPGQKGWVGLGAHSIVFGKTPTEAALLTLVKEIIEVPVFLPTDFDKSGSVDLADFLRLSVSFGKNVGDSTGDPGYPTVGAEIDTVGSNGMPPGDGKIDLADFLQVSTTFGLSSGDVAGVPEPSGIALLVIGGLAMLLRRRHG